MDLNKYIKLENYYFSSDIEFIIGKGSFGEVYKGFYIENK